MFERPPELTPKAKELTLEDWLRLRNWRIETDLDGKPHALVLLPGPRRINEAVRPTGDEVKVTPTLPDPKAQAEADIRAIDADVAAKKARKGNPAARKSKVGV